MKKCRHARAVSCITPHPNATKCIFKGRHFRLNLRYLYRSWGVLMAEIPFRSSIIILGLFPIALAAIALFV
ncbi:hypothetical protein ACVIHF_003092 [Bradyrhizobium sp. USDA 4506]